MKLLRFERDDTETNIDEALMVVPDEYDKVGALEAAKEYIGDCHLVNSAELDILMGGSTSGLSPYRVYVG